MLVGEVEGAPGDIPGPITVGRPSAESCGEVITHGSHTMCLYFKSRAPRPDMAICAGFAYQH